MSAPSSSAPDAGTPIYLRDVATITDADEEPADYVLHGSARTDLQPAVTISLAKRPGANAIDVVSAALAKVDTLRGRSSRRCHRHDHARLRPHRR